MELDYLKINQEAWNKRTAIHVESDFYDMESFLKGKSSLNSFELELLNDVKGKSILHLQCHFGQDTISLAKMGANAVGIDLSDKAIEFAKDLNEKMETNAHFVCSDVYSLPENLEGKFDIVFTSYGTIGWLPDLDKWASVISHFLKLGGELIFVEFHPVVWMFDDEFSTVRYNYFKDEPIIEESTGTYADKESSISAEYVSWNHSLSEVFTALMKNGITIAEFKEFDYSPYNCFSQTEEFEKGKYRIKHFGNKIPMVYALKGKKY